MRRVLVVDDEPVIRSLVQASLAGPDCDVIAAADGPTALASARRSRPDVILLDLAMPGMAGQEVLRRLRSDDATAAIPVLLLTGLAQPAAEAADGIVRKPFTPRDLRAALSAWL